MLNILPSSKTGSLVEGYSKKYGEWKPEAANAVTGKIPQSLQSEISIEKKFVQRYSDNKLPDAQPNEKYADKRTIAKIAESGPSAICESQRGVADTPEIRYEPPKLTHYGKPREKNTGVANFLVMRMLNLLPVSMDLFVQKELSIQSSVTKPRSVSVRVISGIGTLTPEVIDNYSISLLFSTPRIASIVSTGLQEIKDWTFRTDKRIGMEIELSGNRLICNKVIPDAQASEFEVALEGCEVIAVNEKRMLNLQDFQAAMVEAQQYPTVVLKLASYKGGRGRVEDLHFLDAKKNKQVKTLFSNMMLGSTSMDDGDHSSVEEGTSSQTTTGAGSKEAGARNAKDSDDEDYDLYLERKNKKLAEAKLESKRIEDEEREAAKMLAEQQAIDTEADTTSRAVTPGDREQTPLRGAERSMFAKILDLDEEAEEENDDDNISKISDVDGLESVRGELRASSRGDDIASAAGTSLYRDDDKMLSPDSMMEGYDEGIPNPATYGVGGGNGGDGGSRSRGTVYFNDDDEEEDGLMAARRTPLVQHNDEQAVAIVVDPSLTFSSSEAQPQDDNQSTHSKESADSWDFPTALRMDVFPFSTLVCLPHFISRSEGWGKPVFHVQFSNFSRHWKLAIFWVDEDGALVPRGEVALGDHHFELVATEHVWVVVATMMTKKKANHQVIDVEDASKSPALFSFRPSIASLHKNKCTSIVWSPLKSASITQRLYSQKISDSKIPNLKGTVIGDARPTTVIAAEVKPQIHLQMFDGDGAVAATVASHVEFGMRPQSNGEVVAVGGGGGGTQSGGNSPSVQFEQFYAADAKKMGPSTYAKKTHRLPQWPPRRNAATGSGKNTAGVAATLALGGANVITTATGLQQQQQLSRK